MIEKMVTGERWLSVSEACRVLGISRTTLLAAEDAALISPIRTPGGHRRYGLAELRRYLGAAGSDAAVVVDPTAPAAGGPALVGPTPAGASGVGASGVGPPAAGPAVGSTVAPGVAADELAAAVRAAVRPLAHAVEGESAGLYLADTSGLRFCAAFGIPRWLVERLRPLPPPAEVAAALSSRHVRLFDPGAVAFPDARASGHGAAVGVRGERHPLGVLFLITRADRGLLPGEIRMVDAFAEVVGNVVELRAHVSALEDRLDRIAALTGH